MLALRKILVVVAGSFPRPKVREDVIHLIISSFFGLLGAGFEKLYKVIDVLPVIVGERSQPTQVPAEVNELRAPAGEAQHVGGC